jgi:hypothetical protein
LYSIGHPGSSKMYAIGHHGQAATSAVKESSGLIN